MEVENKKRKTVGLVLGAGGGRGMAHIGVIKTLQKHGIPIDYISGSSIGALVGAYFALNQEVDSLEATFKKIFQKPFSLLDFKYRYKSLTGNSKVFAVMKNELYSEKSFEDLRIPFVAVASDLDTDQAHTFRSGKLIDACLASMSIPGLFPVVETNNSHLVDGVLTASLPIKEMQTEFNPDVLIIVDLYKPKDKILEEYKLNTVIERTYEIFFQKLSRINMFDCNRPYIKLAPETNEDWRNLLFKNIDRNIKIGEEECECNMEAIKKMINGD
jgi:Predicted esterase of the alpha-beta hydrolase superfamily